MASSTPPRGVGEPPGRGQLGCDDVRTRSVWGDRQAWAWFVRVVVRFGWFRALPEVAQPIVVGMAVALPTIGVVVALLRPASDGPVNKTKPSPAPIAKQAESKQQVPF